MPASPTTLHAPASAGAEIGLAREAALVGAGGAVGALARSAVAALVAALGGPGLVATSAVNLVGAIALGVLVGRIERRGPWPCGRAFLGVGVLGSFTTFSTLIDDGHHLAEQTSPGVAAAMLAGSLALGIAAFALGHRLATGSPPPRAAGTGPAEQRAS
jgi:CrcB protein